MTFHNDIEYLWPDDRYLWQGPEQPNVRHATGVASKVLGRNLGSCQLCTLIVASLFEGVDSQDENIYTARYLDQLKNIIDDVIAKNRMGMAVINMSHNFELGSVEMVFIREFRKHICSPCASTRVLPIHRSIPVLYYFEFIKLRSPTPLFLPLLILIQILGVPHRSASCSARQSGRCYSCLIWQ